MRWFGLGILLTGTFLANLDVFIVVVAVPDIAADLKTSPAQQLALIAGYQLVYGVGLITAGRLGDRFGIFRVFGWGMALFTTASALCAFAPNAGVLLVARLLQGAGTALLVPQAYSGIQLLFPGHRRSRPFAVLGAVMGIGAISGQLVGGVLLTLDPGGLGWRTIFLINIPVGIAALVAVRYAPSINPRDTKTSFDHVGVALVVTVLAALTTPLLLGPELGWPWWTLVAIAAAVPAGLILVQHERHHAATGRQPLLPPSLASIRSFPVSILLVTLFNSSLNAFFLIFAVYLQRWENFSPLELGAAMVPLALTFAVTSLIVPRLRQRDESILLAGAALATIAYTATAAATQLGSETALIFCLAAIGAGQGLFITPMLSVALRSVPEELAGAGAGVVSTAQQIGAAIGVCVLGIVFYSAIDRNVQPSSAFGIAALCIAAIAALSTVLSLYVLLGHRRHHPEPPSPTPTTTETAHPEIGEHTSMTSNSNTDNPVAIHFPQVHQLIAEHLDSYPRSHRPLADAVADSIAHGRVERNELSLPLLVHGSITGDPAPAIPVAAAHALWWRAANAFDDIADGDATSTLNGLALGAGLMAAQEYGYCLPMRIIEGLDHPAALRQQLIHDFAAGWTSTNDGQVRDVLNDPRIVTTSDVVTTYQHKSSSAYIMATTMAARLAYVAPPALEKWAEFARILGVLGQLRNDQEDLDGGKGEDLSNQTATYLLVRLLDGAEPNARRELTDLIDAASTSPAAAETLRDRLLEPSNSAPVTAWMNELGGTALGLLAELTQPSPFSSELETRVRAAATPTPVFRAVETDHQLQTI